MIVSDPEILSGTPVVMGTRVPAYDVAANVRLGLSVEEILTHYPTITAAQVEACVRFAQAYPNPLANRKQMRLPDGSVIAARRTDPRDK